MADDERNRPVPPLGGDDARDVEQNLERNLELNERAMAEAPDATPSPARTTDLTRAPQPTRPQAPLHATRPQAPASPTQAAVPTVPFGSDAPLDTNPAPSATQVRPPVSSSADPMDEDGANGGAVPPKAPGKGPDRDGSGHHGRRGGSGFWAGAAGGIVGALVIMAIVWGISQLVGGGRSAEMPTVESGAGQTVDITAHDLDATTAEVVAAKCLPSVVSVSVTTSQGEGVGSGVVLDTAGNVITNYHVVEGATDIVATIDNKSYSATVVGSDESSDIAVIKVDLDGASVTPMEVGDSSKLVVGEWVMALGSPFGLDQSVSTGIVSSLYRSTMLEGTTGNSIYTNLIQTDTAINPGNSGGALVNSKGELVGINSIIESASGSSSGVGFAIPSNYAAKVAQTIIEGKTVEHAYLGANVRTVNAAAAKSAHLAVNQGAMIASVVQDSPAANAGLQEGDIITGLGDEDISSADALILAVRSHDVGDTVKLTYYRGTQQTTIDVTLGSDAQSSASLDNRSSTADQGTQGPQGQQDGSQDQGGSTGNLWDRRQ